jgi:CDP-diacylglycerol--serine O-phosphatidyltransferase
LADLVSFGVVPAAMLSRLVLVSDGCLLSISFLQNAILIFPFLIAIFSALRLAKFNIDERQHDSFLGLPTPASAIFVVSTVVAANDCEFLATILHNEITIILSTIILSALMISEIPMFSLKIKFNEGLNQVLKKNIIQITFLIIALIFIILLGFAGISLSIVLYILISIVKALATKK